MFTIDINLEEDFLPKIEERIRKLAKKDLEVGMFRSQGVHTDSGFSYVSLFKYLSDGNPAKNLPPRSPLQTTVALVPLRASPLKKDLRKYLSNVKGNPPISTDTIVEDLGTFYRDKVRSVFGDSGLLAPKAPSTKRRSKSPNTPLIETSELASKIAYKVDNNTPKDVGR